ncbi:hypothetical protein [Microvirga mediterraneensis]|uniref:Uncharacterized protein n=1 Tax=Microvirga mediterraneensis TaxID=2754695 RepID=A0A838BUC7_9HYPH|nr:hypothetical protein [Microvirga mediterraneensis]MBA1158682.1 hypothetical protein [Microvirga mediterraneensis]
MSSLNEITRRLAEHAQAELARFHRGHAMNRHLVTACDQIEKVTKSVDSIETATTIAAMFLLRDQQPRRFVSDQGFIGQTVRQFRLPSGIARGTTYDQRKDKTVGWFRPLSRKTTEVIGRIMVEAYKPWLVHIQAAEKRLTEEEQRVSRDLAAAFAF